jgi:hypothetical protein
VGLFHLWPGVSASQQGSLFYDTGSGCDLHKIAGEKRFGQDEQKKTG